MDQTTQLSPRGAIALGLLVIAMGSLFIMLALGVIHPQGATADQTPPWIGVAAGLIFVFGGVALILGYAIAGGVSPDGDLLPGTPWGIRLTQFLLALAITGAMAAIASWVAFGPGPRAFSMTGSFAGAAPASQWLGRAAFGFGAVLLYLFIAVFAVVGIRRLRSRR